MGIDTFKLDKIIGEKGSAEGGDYCFDIERADKISMNAPAVPGNGRFNLDTFSSPLGTVMLQLLASSYWKKMKWSR